ncbi:hypothetical protein [Pontibacter rugosus]|uniref:Uncharacterized protein n=1 Tax=Pontibacter rugosus TaxID=1745966 RepID=A0ABW3SXV5_9BACT
MKQILFSLLFMGCLSPSLQAQDMIMKRSGEKVEAKVLEITPSEIKYKRFSNQEGPIYILPKADVTLIQYADNSSESFELEVSSRAGASMTGTKDVVADKQVIADADATTTASEESSLSLYVKGQTDASMYYDGYKAAGTATLVTSLLSPVIGLIPAVVCSVTTPQEKNMDAPSHQLLSQQDYKSGYRKNARKVKAGKVWKNWAIGLGVNVVLAVIIGA